MNVIYFVWTIMVVATSPSDILQYGAQQPFVEFYTSSDQCKSHATYLYEHQPTKGRYVFRCVMQMNGDGEPK